MIEIINVDNGSNDYPGSFAKKENEIINKYLIEDSLHLFSGSSLIGKIRIDYSHENASINIDVFEFLVKNNRKFESVIIDAPYNDIFAKKYAKISKKEKQFVIFANSHKTTELFNLIKELNPKRIIMKSWNYYIVKGYSLKDLFICYAGGYRKPIFLLIQDRIE